jgi:hypothetical protein
LLFALLLVAASCCSATLFVAALLAAFGFLVLIFIRVTTFFALSTLRRLIIVIVVLIIVFSFFIILLYDFEVVFECEGDKLILELIGHVEIFVHEFGYVLFFLTTFFVLVLVDLGGFALGQLLLIGHLSRLKEVEETLLLHGLGDGLAWLALLGLLLLLDLLLSHVLAILPVDLSSYALLYHVLILGHYERLAQVRVLEVVVLLKGKDQIETVARVVQVALNVYQVHKDRAILLLNKSSNTAMVKHSPHPETWHAEGTVLDILHIA